jgi:transcriptional regulator with XRE-family HTH domain
MRTTAFAPPYPTDLGSWLAAFRHRVTNARGHPYSPEQLGRLIGVSGATIRRWESGRLRPDPQTAAAMARACKLTSLQVSFLSRSLSRHGPTPVPDFDTFKAKATPILNTEFPVYIMDSMLFIRGWNSYLPHFLSRSRQRPENDYHLIDFIIEADEEHQGVEPRQQERVRRAVMELWWLTSDACGSPEYKALINRLSEYAIFKEEWSRLAFLEEDECMQIGVPRRAWRADVGAALICPFAVVLPPVYQVRQFMPLDDVAQAKLDELRRHGPPEVIFDSRCHWAQTEQDEPFYRVS